MPTILRIGEYRFHFYSDEGNEPPHIHVRKGDAECKFWLEPTIVLAHNRAMKAPDIRSIERLVFENQEKLRKSYNEYHGR